MKIAFRDERLAEAAARVFQHYGYTAELCGLEVETSCPTLLAAAVLDRRVGLDAIETLRFGDGTSWTRGDQTSADRAPPKSAIRRNRHTAVA